MSFSDYDPTPDDISYWQVNADGSLAKGSSFEIRQASLTSGIATLTLGNSGMVTPDGGYIIVTGVGAPFDGEWFVLDSATTEMVVTDVWPRSSTTTVFPCATRASTRANAFSDAPTAESELNV